MIQQNNSVQRWLRAESIGLIIQFIIIIAAFTAGYTRVQSELQELHNQFTVHLSQADDFLPVRVWEVRNKFVDEKLDRIERKLDRLLEQRNR